MPLESKVGVSLCKANGIIYVILLFTASEKLSHSFSKAWPKPVWSKVEIWVYVILEFVKSSRKGPWK